MVHNLPEAEFLGPPKFIHPGFLGRGFTAPYPGCPLIWGRQGAKIPGALSFQPLDDINGS